MATRILYACARIFLALQKVEKVSKVLLLFKKAILIFRTITFEMKKNILVLTSSPRIGGNTDMLADAFINGAESEGNKVVKFDAARKQISGCKACDKCFSNGSACVFNDDFNQLAMHMEAADTLVIITPMYWFTFPSQIKAAIDKFYAFHVAKRECSIKNAAMIVCAETDDEDEFEGIVSTYKLIAGYEKWNNLGVLLVPNVSGKGDVEHTEGLAKAREFGATL